MEMNEVLLIVAIVLGPLAAFFAGTAYKKNPSLYGFFLLAAVIVTFWGVICYRYYFLGNPTELRDGIYEIRIVVIPQAPEQKDVGVLVLKKEGKTPVYPPEYYVVPADLFSLFSDKLPKVGDELTIEIRQSPAKRYLVIK